MKVISRGTPPPPKKNTKDKINKEVGVVEF